MYLPCRLRLVDATASSSFFLTFSCSANSRSSCRHNNTLQLGVCRQAPTAGARTSLLPIIMTWQLDFTAVVTHQTVGVYGALHTECRLGTFFWSSSRLWVRRCCRMPRRSFRCSSMLSKSPYFSRASFSHYSERCLRLSLYLRAQRVLRLRLNLSS